MTPIFILNVPQPIPSTPFDLTAMSGGLSYVNGINGGDWQDRQGGKALGDGRLAGAQGFNLNPGGPLPTPYGNGQGITTTTWQIADTGDGTGSGVGTNAAFASIAWGLPNAGNSDASINWGTDRTISLRGQHLSTLTWIGGAMGGTWSVTVTLTDGSAPPQTIYLDGASRIFDMVKQFWTCTVRTVRDTSMTVRIMRVSPANNIYGSFCEQALVMSAYGLPVLPRGAHALARHRGLFGASS